MRRPAGFSLWELMLTLGVAAVLLGLAVPGFSAFLLDSRRTADINAFVTAVQLARSEAAKRARPIVLCQTPDTFACGAGADYARGWMVFVDADGARPIARSATEELLTTHVPRTSGPIHSNRRLYEFRPFRRRSTNGTITFCDRRGAAQARAVIVSYTARPRVAPEGPGGRELTCARLP